MIHGHHVPTCPGSQDWLRVVAVITNGEEWEFQGLSWWDEGHQNLTFKYRRMLECKFEDGLMFFHESTFIKIVNFL